MTRVVALYPIGPSWILEAGDGPAACVFFGHYREAAELGSKLALDLGWPFVMLPASKKKA